MLKEVKSRRGGRRPGAGRKPGANAGLPAAPCVYVLTEGEADRPAKVGVTTNLRHRMSLIGGGNHRPLIVRYWQPIADAADFIVRADLQRRRIRADWYDVGVREAIAAAKAMASPAVEGDRLNIKEKSTLPLETGEARP